MTNSAIQIIEEVYEMALNPTQSYFGQLEPLAASGELANRISANKVLFKLCELVDQQARRIQSLEDDRKEIANQMVALQSRLSKPAIPDPTLPLDALAQPAQPTTHNPV